MKLTDGERLIAFMLAEVMETVGGDHEIDPKLVKRLIANKEDWALSWQYPGIFDGEARSEEVVKETADILSMWSFIEFSIGKLTGTEAQRASKFLYSSFEGFDGNHDPHLGVARTMIDDLDRFIEFKGRGLNSHSQASLARYRSMLPKYDSAMTGTMGKPLAFDVLEDLLN